MVRIALLAAIALSSAFTVWSATRRPDMWELGCIAGVAGLVFASVAFGMLNPGRNNDKEGDPE